MKENGDKFPEKKELAEKEKLYWDLLMRLLYLRAPTKMDLIENLFAVSQWDGFSAFSKDYVSGSPSHHNEISVCQKTINLLRFYWAFPSEEARKKFLMLCPIGEAESSDKIIQRKVNFLHIYQAFPAEKQRNDFLEFSKRWQGDGDLLQGSIGVYQVLQSEGANGGFLKLCKSRSIDPKKYEHMKQTISLLTIYKKVDDDNARQNFLKFYDSLRAACRMTMEDFLPIYQAFPSDQDRKNFVQYYSERVGQNDGVWEKMIEARLSLYQVAPSEEDRKEFLSFVESCVSAVDVNNLLSSYMYRGEDKEVLVCAEYLTSIYKTDHLRDHFLRFLKPYEKIGRKLSPSDLINYMRGDCLYLERAVEAAGVRKKNEKGRVQGLFETKLEDCLPALFPQDPLLRGTEEKRTSISAHELEKLYVPEFELLRKEAAKIGYEDNTGTKAYTLFNNGGVNPNFHTNTEVEDFIEYLDELEESEETFRIDGEKRSALEIVSLAKQILGLEKKTAKTSGVFEPYLGSSMLFGVPNVPNGDEVLARLWYLMKEKDRKEAEDAVDEERAEKAEASAEDYKRSVFLAILEAAEVNSDGTADTHCQTRVTGELLKLAAHHLKGSELIKWIAPAKDYSDDMTKRIEGAALAAGHIFRSITNGKVFRRLMDAYEREDRKPEAFELCRLYYGTLYGEPIFQETVIVGYKENENALTMDEKGNLISLYDEKGIRRIKAKIVYIQAQFLAIEQEFTKLLREALKIQGLKY